MITGVDVDSILQHFGDRGLYTDDCIRFLLEHRIFPRAIPVMPGMPYLLLHGVYLIAVQSLNNLNGSHYIVCQFTEDEGPVVFDPSTKITYASDDIANCREIGVLEVLYMDYKLLEKKSDYTV
jgi:hypothetical protein